MGTRGAFGVIIGEKEKIGYNQFDSYPEGMGIVNLMWLRAQLEEETGLDELRRLAEDLQVVSEKTPPALYDIEQLAGVTNLGVSEGTTDDWYCLTRETHGDIGKTLKCGYVLDNHKFPLDSLFCEWAYLVDLDAGNFEVYKGFTKSPPTKGRWAGQREEPSGNAIADEYYAVELVASWPLDALPGDGEFISVVTPKEEEGW